MDSVDLNINHYNFNELMNIFKIDKYDKTIDYKSQLDRKVISIQEKYPDEIASFYQKTKLILLSIFSLLDNNFIKKQEEIENYVEKIKYIPHLERKKENEIINELLNLNDVYTDKESNNILNETNILETNHLNKPNLNLHSGRVDPSLDNKNNTNQIYNTFPNDITPGNLNSVKRITQLLNLNLNSCFRNNYYQTNPCDFLYLFPIEIKNVLSMRLASIEIPNAWYLFSKFKKNNFFEIDIFESSSESSSESIKKYNYLIIIPDGNYDIDSLQYYLNTTYFYQSEQTKNTPLKYIQFSIDPFSLKSCFQILNPENSNTFTFTLKFIENINQNSMNTMGWLLGYRLGTYIGIEDSLVSEGLFDGGGDRYIYVCINDFQYNNNNSNIVCFDKSILNEDVIAKIPMINGKLSLIVNDNNQVLAKLRRYNGPVNISRLQIKILDKFGTIIDLNNMDFSFTLEMELLYESFNFKNVTS
jgi:hypothetical protein